MKGKCGDNMQAFAKLILRGKEIETLIDFSAMEVKEGKIWWHNVTFNNKCISGSKGTHSWTLDNVVEFKMLNNYNEEIILRKNNSMFKEESIEELEKKYSEKFGRKVIILDENIEVVRYKNG